MAILSSGQIIYTVGIDFTYKVGCQVARYSAQIIKPEYYILFEEVKRWYECQHEKVCQCHVQEKKVARLKPQ